MSLNTHELAWAAGFFDGEGSTFNSRNGAVLLSVSQKNILPLQRFSNAVNNVGKIRYSNDYHKITMRNQELYKFTAENFEHVQYVIALLWKFLCQIKKNQYKVAVEYCLLNCKKNNYLMTPKAISQRNYVKRKKGRAIMDRWFSSLPSTSTKEFINPFKQKSIKEYEVIDVQ